jgi:hypothetical protein
MVFWDSLSTAKAHPFHRPSVPASHERRRMLKAGHGKIKVFIRK